MLFPELPIPFPFFDSKEKQARYNINSDEPCGPYLITPKDALLPFQIRKNLTSEIPSTAEIFHTEDDTLFEDVTVGLIPLLHFTSLESWDYITHLGDRLPGGGIGYLDMPPGEYYVKLSFPNGEEYFSENFRVPLERFGILDLTSCKFIKLEWSNPSDISPIHYDSNSSIRLVNRLYLDSIIKNTEPEVEQEGTRNGDNELIPSFQKVTVKYRISDVVPDFLKLAISTIPIHDNIVLTTEYGKRSGQIYRVSTVSQAEETGGYFSDVDILFEQDLVLIRRGCDDNMIPPVCPAMPGSVALSSVPNSTGITVYATLPDGVYAEIYNSYTAVSTPTLVASRVYKSQLATGYSIPYTSLVGDWFQLRLKTFTCVVGDSVENQSTPALGFHPAAIAFKNALEADPANSSFGTMNPVVVGWLSDFVVELVTGNIYDKFQAIYPFIFHGDLEASFRYNLKDPRDDDSAFRLQWPNGWAFINSNGIQFDGFNQYGNTFFRQPVAYPSGNSASMIARITPPSLGTTNYRGLGGAYANNLSRYDSILSSLNYSGHAFDTLNPTAFTFTSAGDLPGVHTISRRSGTAFEYYKDGVSKFTQVGPILGAPPAVDVWMGAVNGLPAAGFTEGTFTFFALGEGLTDAEQLTLFTAIDNLNSNIGR